MVGEGITPSADHISVLQSTGTYTVKAVRCCFT